jgi:microcin C transport system substrate-binding protein
MSKTAWAITCVAAALTANALFASPAQAIVRGKPVHGLALYGEPKHGPNEAFPYNNANAPKGGTLRLQAPAPTFDSLNPFSAKGVPAAGLGVLGANGPIVEGLTQQGEDEPFTQYCLLCETMELAEDNTWIEYTLRAEARFSDGTPVTPEDVIASLDRLREKGAPIYRMYWSDVDRAEKTGPNKVRFLFKNGENHELPLILGQLPILQKAFWDSRDIAESTLDKPPFTGPYLIDSFEPGRFVVLKRNPDYWGKDLAIARGTYNFDEIRFEYFRDDTVAFEAFKSGTYDIHYENTARRWATGYDFPAFNDGRVKKMEVEDSLPKPAQAFYYNMRRAKFADRRVRQALNYAFDFESMNKTIFYEQYTRLRSYVQQSDMEPTGLPGPEELALLEPLRDKVPPEVFTQEFTQPTTAGDGNPRDNLIKARDLLTAAGWEIVDGVLKNKTSGEAFTFELLTVSPTTERIATPWMQNLEKLGIKSTLRVIDASQIVNRVNSFDYDVISSGLQNSLSPGNEQAEYWGSDAAERQGSRNYGGVKDPALDALIAALLKAPDRPGLVTAMKAIDRVLTWNFYNTLQYTATTNRFAYWSNKLARPETFPMHGMATPSAAAINWWAADANAQTPGAPGAEADSSGGNTGTIVLALILAGIVGFILMRRRRS